MNRLISLYRENATKCSLDLNGDGLEVSPMRQGEAVVMDYRISFHRDSLAFFCLTGSVVSITHVIGHP